MSDLYVPPVSPPPFAAVASPVNTPRHSVLGVTSFVIGLVAAVGVLADFVVAGVVQLHGNTAVDEQDDATLLIGIAIFVCCFIALIGLILGIIGAVQSQRKKLFAWIGLGLNLGLIVSTLGLLVLGYAAKDL